MNLPMAPSPTVPQALTADEISVLTSARSSRARRRAQRRHPGPQLPGARGPGRRRPRRRLARPQPPARPTLRPTSSPSAASTSWPRRRRSSRREKTRADPRSRRRLLARRLDHRPTSCGRGRRKHPGARRRHVRQHHGRGQGADRLLRDLLQRGQGRRAHPAPSTGPDRRSSSAPTCGSAPSSRGRPVQGTERCARFHVWDGECHVHAGIRPEDITATRADQPRRRLPDPPRVRLLDPGDGVRRRRRHRAPRASTCSSTGGMHDARRGATPTRAARRSSPPRPAMLYLLQQAAPQADLIAANETRLLQVHEDDHAAEAARQPARPQRRGQGRPGARRARARADRADGRDRLNQSAILRGVGITFGQYRSMEAQLPEILEAGCRPVSHGCCGGHPGDDDRAHPLAVDIGGDLGAVSFAVFDPYPDTASRLGGAWRPACSARRTGAGLPTSRASTTTRPRPRRTRVRLPARTATAGSIGTPTAPFSASGRATTAREDWRHGFFGIAPAGTARLVLADEHGRERDLRITPFNGAYVAYLRGTRSTLMGYDAGWRRARDHPALDRAQRGVGDRSLALRPAVLEELQQRLRRLGSGCPVLAVDDEAGNRADAGAVGRALVVADLLGVALGQQELADLIGGEPDLGPSACSVAWSLSSAPSLK